jgi:hypothetical protein
MGHRETIERFELLTFIIAMLLKRPRDASTRSIPLLLFLRRDS